MTVKRCSSCKEIKPVSEFYVHRPDGYQGECKACLKARTARRRANCVPATEGTKKCDKCAQIKPVTEFQVHKIATDGRSGTCKKCCCAYSAKWKRNNRDKINAATRRAYHRDPERARIKVRQYTKAWKERNPESADRYDERNRSRSKEWHANNLERARQRRQKYYATNRAKALQDSHDWRKANPERYKATNSRNHKDWTANNREKAREKVRRRRVRRQQISGSHTRDEWLSLVNKYQGRCVCCGEHFGASKLTRDHVIPIVNGGPDHIDNIQPLCKECNSSKGKRHSTDYRKMPFTGKGSQRLF